MSFVIERGIYSAEQLRLVKEILDRVEREQLDWIRVAFADQHGVLRGKTVVATQLAGIFRDGLPVVSTLLLKDTSGNTSYPAFSSGGGVGIDAMSGAGNILMVPDPETFRILNRASPTGWLLCDLYFSTGEAIPLCSRGLLRKAIGRAAASGYTARTGVELEFHLFRTVSPHRTPSVQSRLEGAHGIELLNDGYQLLSEDRFDAAEDIMTAFAESLRQVELPLRTLEVEFGPSQFEVTLSPQDGVAAADSVIILRSALRYAARRMGYHITFMCRPQIPQVLSSGWHLHQSLLRQDAGGLVNAFVPDQGEDLISGVGRRFLAGQLRHARAATLFAVPTINGYKRFRPYSMAPDRVAWGRDNRAAMLRVMGSAEDGSTHVENRVGEPAANPYLYIGSQLIAGLNGIEGDWELGPAADQPYETEAPRLPATLDEAIDALEADTDFRHAMGEKFVDYYLGIKRHELGRFNATVTDWEQKEYFELF